MATNVSGAVHISPRCVRVDFDKQMRNNSYLRDAGNYRVRDVALAISATVVSVHVPTAQSPRFVGPSPDGGAPRSVYVVVEEDLRTLLGTSFRVDVANSGPTHPVDYYTGAWLALATATAPTYTTYAVDYSSARGLRTEEALRELSRIGKARFTSAQPNNYGMLQMFGKLADIASGGLMTTLETAISGPFDTDVAADTAYSPGGFPIPDVSVPDVGSTISLGSLIPHVDRLWGPCDGSNTLFRTSIFYHPFSCDIYVVPPPGQTEVAGYLEPTEWFSPDSGKDRLVRLISAPSKGSAVLAIYKPRETLLRIGHEILAVSQISLVSDNAVICGRAQLCTPMEAHSVGDTAVDVWAASFVDRACYAIYAFGSHGRALEYISHDRGVPHDDNLSLSFTDLRRAIFNTASQMRTTTGSVLLALRYVFPRLWPYIIVDEDPRWPDCIVVWYSSDVIGDVGGVWATAPGVEPWETWLDHLAYMDGLPFDLYNDTYARSPSTDVTYDGDYFLSSGAEDPELWPYPVVVSGPYVHILGEPAPFLPLPADVSEEYLKFLVRPKSLDRVLASGVGLLLLDYGWA